MTLAGRIVASARGKNKKAATTAAAVAAYPLVQATIAQLQREQGEARAALSHSQDEPMHPVGVAEPPGE